MVDALAGLANAIPRPDREPSVEEMLQAMNGGGQAADEDAAGVA